ncbi:hypothetical protein ACFLVP_00530 [Chloroflexota bacterium]
MSQKNMVIVSNYSYEQDNYSLLGPQMAATIIEDNSDYECNVLAIGRDFDKKLAKVCIEKLLDGSQPIVGFSHLAERSDLYNLARELKEEGAVTILGGPQSDVNYVGEIGWQQYDHRFHGLADAFTFAIHGPAEQLVPFLNSDSGDYQDFNGFLYAKNGEYKVNPESKWNEARLRRVRWDNLYGIGSDAPESIKVTNVQVLYQLGCPYAAKKTRIGIDYPTNIHNKPFGKTGSITIDTCGCSFCDVARDKGLGIRMPVDAVLEQIANVPENEDGKKVPFELINENPFLVLRELLLGIKDRGIDISQVNLVTRADWLIKGEDKLRDALGLAEDMGIRFLMSGVGFESFADSILRNLNKGYTVATNIAAVKLMRKLKEQYPDNFLYSPSDGAIHGFIHPTPWDTGDTKREMYRNIAIYGLDGDVLPSTSIPLIIHHACWLADWTRELESKENIKLNRDGSLIEWW